MEPCNARTMEFYRRMGIAGRVRAAGLPPDVPMDVFIVFSLVEPPLLRLSYPSVAQAQAEIAATADDSQPLEPYQLISQYTLEPLLKAIAEELPTVAVRYGHELTAFTDNGGSVTAHIRRSDGTTADISADYLVGCDGGTSAVRKQLGIKLQGDGNIGQFRQALYRCDDLFDRIPIGKGGHYHVADAQSSFLITQDSTKHFTLHATVDSDDEMKTMFEKVVAMPVAYEMLSCAPWKQNLLLADSYGRGRVLLAGDAVHLVIPTGGLGLNTGARVPADHRRRPAAGPQRCAPAHAGRRPQRRGLALRGDRTAQVARHVPAQHPRQYPGGRADAGEADRDGRRGAAQIERDDRRRARLSLRRLAADLAGARRGAGARFHDLRAVDLAGRAAAACLAGGPDGIAGPHRLWRPLHAAAVARARRHVGPGGGDAVDRRALPGARPGRRTCARHLWLCSDAAAARHAHRV